MYVRMDTRPHTYHARAYEYMYPYAYMLRSIGPPSWGGADLFLPLVMGGPCPPQVRISVPYRGGSAPPQGSLA